MEHPLREEGPPRPSRPVDRAHPVTRRYGAARPER